MVCSFFNKKPPSTILSQTAAGQAEPKKVRIFSTKSCFLIIEAAWSEMLQLHFQGVWTVNGKKYTKADFLACDKQGNTAGQALGPKEKRFQIKTVCTSGEAGWKSYPNQPPCLLQNKLHCQTLYKKDKQAPAFCYPTPVVPCCIFWSHMPNLVPLQI